jgi:hydrogenase expression/formation protein HypE
MSIITLAHGSGGKMSHNLIGEVFYKYFHNEYLLQQNDSSVMPSLGGKLAVTTDSFVVDPIFFKGGDIGKLAVCGTVNDLAMSGAKPLYITAAFIIEEGFEIRELEKIVKSMADAAKEAGVCIVAGDTKVVPRGKADKIFINTTGVGVIKRKLQPGGEKACKGDKVIISGSIGDHGACIMASRINLDFETSISSDCGLLNGLINEVLNAGCKVKVLRDPTRGGLATTLNEIANQSKVSIALQEEQIPVKDEVRGICEILGLDPLYVANEGKLILIVDAEDEEKVLKIMQQHPMGTDARTIGDIIDDNKEMVYLKTPFGGTRVLNMLTGELLPRIC